MAPPDRPAPDHLSFLAGATESLRRSGLFGLVRRAEALGRAKPRVGHSRRPDQNIVDLAQVPTLAFPDSTLESIVIRNGRARVDGYWLGLTGPMGALPTHLTEFAAHERRYAKKRPFGNFLDLLAGRMLQLFYRSWADSQPVAHADREDDDRFAYYVGALSGATEGVPSLTCFPAKARLHYASLFAGRRSAAAIEDALAHLLGLRVRILEFQPRWRDIEVEDQSRLGQSFATLGSDVVAGRRVRSASDAFRVVVTAGNLRELEALLPSGPRFAIAAEALDAFAPDHLEWDLMIEIDESQVPPARLDGLSRLGWTGWLAPRGTRGVRADPHLRKSAAHTLARRRKAQ